MRTQFIALFAIVLTATLPLSAEDKKATAGTITAAEVKLGRPVDFNRDVYPILEANCVACHNVAIDESRLNLEEVKLILKGGKRGPAVVPKDLEKSWLYQVASRAKKPHMPPLPNEVDAKSITPKELGIIKQWIMEGATAGSGPGTENVNWQPLPSGLNAIYSVALSPWSRLAAAGRANKILTYEPASGRELGELTDPRLSSIQFDGKPMYPGGAAHRDFVNALAFNHDGTLLASGGYRCVKLWQRPQTAELAKFTAGGSVTAIAVSPDGKLAAVGSADKTIKLIQTADGKQTKQLAGHAGPVTGLEFSKDGKQLFSTSHDKTVRGWNVGDGKEALKIETPAPANDLILSLDGKLAITAHADNTIRVWNTTPAAKPEDANKPVREIKGHSKPVTSLSLVLPAGTLIVSGSEDNTARTWTLSNGRQARSFNHGGAVRGVAARPDGKAIATAGDNNLVKLFDINNSRELAKFQGTLTAIQAVTAANEHKTVADQIVKLADAAVKAAEKNLTDRTAAHKTATEAKKKADAAIAAPKKKLEDAKKKLAAEQAALAKKKDDKNLQKKVEAAQKAVDKEAAEVKKAEDAQKSADRAVNLAAKAIERAKKKVADEKAAQVTAKKSQTDAVTAATAAQKADGESRKPFTSVAFSADGKVLACGSAVGQLQVLSGSDLTSLSIANAHQGRIAVVAFGSGSAVISGGDDKQTLVTDTNPAWKLVATLGAKSEDPMDITGSPFAGRVLALNFSPDGKLLASGGGEPSRSGEIVLWDVEKKAQVRKLTDAHSDTVLGLDFSRDGKQLASCAADKFVKVWTVADGKQVRSYEGHTHHVLDVSWRADGTRLVSAGADNVVKVWNAETGEQVTTITGFGKQVTSVQFIGTGDNIVSSGGDKTVRLHTASNRRNYRNFSGGTDYMYSAACSRDESLIVAGGEDGTLRIWNAKNGQSLFTFAPPAPPAGDQQASK